MRTFERSFPSKFSTDFIEVFMITFPSFIVLSFHIGSSLVYCLSYLLILFFFKKMAQLYAYKLFTGLAHNTTALRAVTTCLTRSYAKVHSPEDYGYCKFLHL